MLVADLTRTALGALAALVVYGMPVAAEEATAAGSVRVELSEPVTVAMAPPEIRGWGPYQFPGLARLPDGRIQVCFHVEADSATAYGLPPARALSADEGKTWTLLPREEANRGAMVSWASPPLRLPSGDVLTVKQLRSRPVSGLKLPEKPLAKFPSYAVTHAYYRVEDLPRECCAGWVLYRLKAGEAQPKEEQALVHIPGEARCVTEGHLTFPWFEETFLAPDGAVWAVNYDHRVVDGRLQDKICAKFLRSTDNGHTFDLWSEIPYSPDSAADPKAAKRDGFTEPTVCFMPDGSVFCLLRTHDGNGVGPLYWARSPDNGRTWTRPAVFDDLGVWPQMLRLKNGVTLAVYGRPGLYVRATVDPAGLRWEKRVTVLPPSTGTCSYAAVLPLGDHAALLAYSNFELRNADGKLCKGIQVQRVTVTRDVGRGNGSGGAAKFNNGAFSEFAVRPDSEGKHIDAHHGGVIFVNGKYWWYGQTFQEKSTREGGQATTVGVVIYGSPDLLAWKYEGVILPCQPSGDLEGPLRFERAKIIYNERTRKFVLWCHYVCRPGNHGSKVGTADAGVASCDTINGNYEWHGYHRPLGPGMTVKDCTLFKDDDGTAYFIFDSYPTNRSQARCLHIARLSDDYLKAVEVRRITGAEQREAPAMVKRNGYYFLITSGVTSWEPNAAKYYRATNIWGPYQDLGNFCLGEQRDITFNAQATYIFGLHDAPGCYVFMGDRWCQSNMARSAHIWLPLEFPTRDTVRLRYFKEWKPSTYHSD